MPPQAAARLRVAYLALPFDLVPDFIPLLEQLDDAILLALVLRAILCGSDGDLLREHWPGPKQPRVLRPRACGRSR